MVCVCVYDGDSHAQIRSVLRNRPAWGQGYNLVTAVDPINKESLQAKSMDLHACIIIIIKTVVLPSKGGVFM